MAKPPPRLFVEENLGASLNINLGNAHAHYLMNVLRLKASAAVALFNGRDGEWHGTLNLIRKSRVTVNLVEMVSPQPNTIGLTLMFAPVKRVPMEIMIQKATELGVTHLQPMITDFTDVVRFNANRMRVTAIEAAEQCGRMSVPLIEEPQPLNEILAQWPKGRHLIFAAESGSVRPIAEALGEFKNHSTLDEWSIAVGPVGGFSPAEHGLLRTLPFVVAVGLGPRLLKAETAALAALSCWQSVLGDWENRPIDRIHQ